MASAIYFLRFHIDRDNLLFSRDWSGRKIFEIHLKKRRKRDVRSIDIDKLVSETEGYSGADIEGVVNESVESAFVKGYDTLTTEELLECIHNTNSLSVIMKGPIEKMAKLYEERKLKAASR